MAERPDEAESWTIGRRAGRIAGIAAVAIPAMLLGGVVLAGRFYDRDVRPETHRPITTFPAPGVETFIHLGALDPHRPAPHPRPDPAVVTAKQAVARDGLSGWTAR